jgi:hypothetical protein
MSATLELPKKELLPPLLRIGDVARLLSISPQSVRNLILSGDLKASDINAENAERKHVRITRDSLLKFYKRRFGHCLLDAMANSYQP